MVDSLICKVADLRLQLEPSTLSPCGKFNCFVCLNDCEACSKLNCSCRKLISKTQHVTRGQTGNNFWQDSITIELNGVGDSSPIKSFRDASLPEVLIENLKRLSYLFPTPVQMIAIPVLLEGKDLVARAETGSGKTAAFLIPIISTLLKKKDSKQTALFSKNPFAIILSPTRELALQINREAIILTKNTNIKTICTYGGISTKIHISEMANGCDILIGTLGRISHLLELRHLSLKDVKVVIIDEGDHMLDKNFVKDLTKLMKKYDMPEKPLRQTALFCATLPLYKMEQCGKSKTRKKKLDFFSDTIIEFLNECYAFADIGNNLSSPKCINQQILYVENPVTKFEILEEKIKEELSQKNKTIVFLKTIKDVINVAQILCVKGYPLTIVHSKRSQQDRTRAMHEFNEGIKPLLVCTNISARGLDIFEVKTVINYDLPDLVHDEIETYIYRIGRTGRAGNSGKSISMFVKGRDEGLAQALVIILGKSEQEVPLWLEELCQTKEILKIVNFAEAKFARISAAKFGEKNSSIDTRDRDLKGKSYTISVDFSELTSI